MNRIWWWKAGVGLATGYVCAPSHLLMIYPCVCVCVCVRACARTRTHVSCSVVSNPLYLCNPMDCSQSSSVTSQPITRLLCPWDPPGKNTGVSCHFLLQRIFPTQGSNPGLLHCRQSLYHLSHQGSPLTNPYTGAKEPSKVSGLYCGNHIKQVCHSQPHF